MEQMLQSTQVGLPSAPIPIAYNREKVGVLLILNQCGGAVISSKVELVLPGVAGKLTEAYLIVSIWGS